MFRNTRNVLLVVFAVVLGLPASQGQRPFFGADNCWLALYYKGDIYCKLSGYSNYNGWNFGTCELGCGDQTVPLPNEACPNGTMHNPCTDEELKHLQQWAKQLSNKKEKNKG
ncbi:uncharacterized protein LOC120846663 [Ixodes scapularis]|uniref:uncharacterized protein LOC120846663 n=1 Tax=Ixodes scapularis TaxID=6945 RepID=UPI001A9CF721|nr:uncharacterized protein LOC120846663 [Ixodes scapularis]